MYYALIMLSVVMFSGCFALKENYGKRQGSGIKQSMVFLLISSVAGLVVMAIFGGFKLSYTHFTGIMALLSSLNALGFTLCSFKALNTINLSVFSLYSASAFIITVTFLIFSPFSPSKLIERPTFSLARIGRKFSTNSSSSSA